MTSSQEEFCCLFQRLQVAPLQPWNFKHTWTQLNPLLLQHNFIPITDPGKGGGGTLAHFLFMGKGDSKGTLEVYFLGGGVGRGEKQEVEGTILASKNMFSGVEKLLLDYFQLNVCVSFYW